MVANWFEVKIKYNKITEEGKEVKVSETHLIDAMSFTEAESRIITSLKEMIQGDFYIVSIKKSNITELIESDDINDDKYFKAKIAIIDADQISGKIKRSNQYFLIAGADVDRALEYLKKTLSTYVVPTDIVSLGDSNIIDVFHYFNSYDQGGSI